MAIARVGQLASETSYMGEQYNDILHYRTGQ